MKGKRVKYPASIYGHREYTHPIEWRIWRKEYYVLLDTHGENSPAFQNFVSFRDFYLGFNRRLLKAGSITREMYRQRICYLYRLTHREHLLECQKKWELEHPDICRERFRTYHRRHKRKIRKYNWIHYRVHKEKILPQKREYSRQYYREHREEILQKKKAKRLRDKKKRERLALRDKMV